MATTYNLDITQGSTYSVRLIAKNDDGTRVNLSGYNARGYMKYRFSDTGLLLNLTPTIHASLVSGIIDISLSGSQTAALPVVQALYDIEIYTSAGYVTQLINGYANIHPEVTY